MIFKILPTLPQYPPGHHKCTHVKVYSADEIEHLLRRTHFRILAYDTFSNVPLFNIADKLMSIFLRGPLKKYKWERVYFYVEKGADEIR